MSGEMRVRVFEKDEGVPQRRESLQLGCDAIDVSTREEQEPAVTATLKATKSTDTTSTGRCVSPRLRW